MLQQKSLKIIYIIISGKKIEWCDSCQSKAIKKAILGKIVMFRCEKEKCKIFVKEELPKRARARRL